MAECRTEAAQNRVAENFGCSTSVPPDHSEDRNEYDSALVWNSGRWTRLTSAGVSRWRAAPTCPAHRQFACVQTTPLGREVVPEVYWMLAAADHDDEPGYGSGSVASSAASESAPAAPAAYSRACGAATATSCIRSGVVITNPLPLCPSA